MGSPRATRVPALLVAALLAVAACAAPGEGPPVPRPAPAAAVKARLSLAMDVTERRRHEIEGWLRARPEVTAVDHETRELALARFRQEFRDSPELAGSVSAAELPESLLVTLTDGADADAFVAAAQVLDGVDHAGVDVAAASPAAPG